ncbi:hypothetical protein QC763_403765 [Podospora pseudopauciseta]|uniref:Uncharacterized protein n=1 Tax=Podospora pseudopauciseta TaxID=2093780 RepID=A0ABR0HCD2_9PEZI|nr:hypothetical protein QC763_403765 [Podospora pseudopauciseta]
MKTAIFSLLALATSALAGPVVTESQLSPRQLEGQADQLDTLLALVQTHTGNINSTTAAVQDNPSVDQQNAAAAALAPDFNAITSALTSATTLLAKRAWEDTVIFARTGGDDKDGGHGGGKDGPNKSCTKECLLVKIELLVWEIACTIKLVIIKLGLACVLQILTPLLLALVGLIKALDKVVLGLVIVVKALLHTILGTVAGALLALIIW